MIATAPGKLIVSGEYAVLDGAPALVLAVDRRVVARRGAATEHAGFLRALVDELAARGLPEAAARARTVVVDSSAFFADAETKLGLGSSAAVTVAATAYALADPALADAAATDRRAAPVARVFDLASAAHATCQRARGAAGSGADVASAAYGGAIAFALGTRPRRLALPAVQLVPFFTGRSADTATFVARVAAATSDDVAAALRALSDASQAAIAAASPGALVDALRADADAFDALARAAALPALVPDCVRAVRAALPAACVKTTGAGGGDVALVVAPPGADPAAIRAAIVAARGTPLDLAVDPRGVDIAAASE